MPDHRRFFVSPEQIVDGTATITGDTARQITKVLRLREGAVVRVLDGLGNEYSALISAVDKWQVTARILGPAENNSEPKIRLSLAICLPKGNKLELVVQKCTELGIYEMLAVESERTVAKLDEKRARERVARWQRIAGESSEQSGRVRAPRISGVMDWQSLMGRVSEADLALVAWEEEATLSLKGILRENANADSVLMIIGPEGGLTETEVDLVRQAGAQSVSLGKRLLRAETAAIACCAAVMYELDW